MGNFEGDPDFERAWNVRIRLGSDRNEIKQWEPLSFKGIERQSRRDWENRVIEFLHGVSNWGLLAVSAFLHLRPKRKRWYFACGFVWHPFVSFFLAFLEGKLCGKSEFWWEKSSKKKTKSHILPSRVQPYIHPHDSPTHVVIQVNNSKTSS